jgi:hypothetical protein
LTTRETVLMLTFASAATSRIVGRDLSAVCRVNVDLRGLNIGAGARGGNSPVAV